MKPTIIYGLHAVTMLLSKQPERVTRILVAGKRDDKKMSSIMALVKEVGVSVETTSKKKLDELASDGNHQGVLAYCKKMQSMQEADLFAMLTKKEEPALLLILDGVTDPHNLGACFRTADAAGVDAIIAPKDNAAGITPTVAKVACGATETVPFVQVTNLARTIKKLKEENVWVFGLAGEAEHTIYTVDWKGAVAIAMGAEGKGLRRLTRESCDALVKIPMMGSVSSLNVSVATGIALFEAVRGRLTF